MSWHIKSLPAVARIVAGLIVAGVVAAVLMHPASDPQLPSWQVTGAVPPSGIERCAACHEQECQSFLETPHWNTLHSAHSSEARANWDGVQFLSPADGWLYRYEQRDGKLWLHCSALPGPRRVDWIFGSGTHAQTPVSTWVNPEGEMELVEHRVTRYPPAVPGLTLGLDEKKPLPAGLQALGKWHSPGESRQCFGCHAGHLPHQQGVLQIDQLVPGVHCARCHFESDRHATQMELGLEIPPAQKIEKLSELTSKELIERCGECHRRADQFPEDELIPSNPLLVRFAPVGIALSPCFQHSTTQGTGSRFDCLTCHDPHQPSATSAEFSRQKCLACHSDPAAHPAVCPSQPLSSDCLPCHMPQVPINSQLSFTDHWIRVRSPQNGAPSPAAMRPTDPRAGE